MEKIDFFYEDDKLTIEGSKRKRKNLFGPLHHIRKVFEKCSESDECYKNVRVHKVDYRENIKMADIYNDLKNIIDHLNGSLGVGKISHRSYNFIISGYPSLIKKIIELFGPIDSMGKIVGDPIALKEITKKLIKNENGRLDLIMEGLEKDTHDEIDKYIELFLNKNIIPLAKVFVESLDASTSHLKEFHDNLANKDLSRTSIETITIASKLKDDLNNIYIFLLEYGVIFMDVYVITKIFNPEIKNIVIYAGDDHITAYRLFFDSIIDSVKIYEFNYIEKPVADIDYIFGDDGYVRCIPVPQPIMNKLLTMKLQ